MADVPTPAQVAALQERARERLMSVDPAERTTIGEHAVYVYLTDDLDVAVAKTVELVPSRVMVDYDASGNPVGVEVLP